MRKAGSPRTTPKSSPTIVPISSITGHVIPNSIENHAER